MIMKSMKYLMSAIIFIFLTSSATRPNKDDSKISKEDKELADRIRMSFRGGILECWQVV